MQYHLFALSCQTPQVNAIFNTQPSKLYRLIKVDILKTSNFMVNDYSMFDCLSTMNGRGSSDGAFRLLYNWVDCWCTHAWDKKTREMDTTLSMRDRLYMRYRYFNDFRHGISVLVSFSLLYWVPPNAPSFTHYLPPLWDIFHYPPLKEIDWKSYEIVKCLASISVMKNVGEWASESGGWVGEMVTYQ